MDIFHNEYFNEIVEMWDRFESTVYVAFCFCFHWYCVRLFKTKPMYHELARSFCNDALTYDRVCIKEMKLDELFKGNIDSILRDIWEAEKGNLPRE